MSNEDLIQFLRIVSMLGMVAFNVMITALIYWKLQVYYPEWIKKHKWIFVVVAVLMSFFMLFIFNRFYVHKSL